MSDVVVSGTGLSEAALLDLADMPALPCESQSHSDPEWSHLHDDGPATHYAQVRHTCNGWKQKGEVYPVCAKRAARLMWLEAAGRGVNCTTCGQSFADSTDWILVVGPIKGRKR